MNGEGPTTCSCLDDPPSKERLVVPLDGYIVLLSSPRLEKGNAFYVLSRNPDTIEFRLRRDDPETRTRVPYSSCSLIWSCVFWSVLISLEDR